MRSGLGMGVLGLGFGLVVDSASTVGRFLLRFWFHVWVGGSLAGL